jgi:MarR family transcriptional regulator, 2-MHQ and catechol-resistance regulon repressor
MSSRLIEQATRLYRVATAFVMEFQFRDRNEMLCYGVTVSQCYVLEALEFGPLYMQDVAERLNVANSTVTRSVDRLVARGLVERRTGERDRRSVQIGLTASGRELLAAIQGEIIADNRAILETLPEDVRDQVIDTIQRLSDVIKNRQTKGLPPGEP